MLKDVAGLETEMGVVRRAQNIVGTSAKLPHLFKPRPYQKDLLIKTIVDRIKRGVVVWHRRAGKDKTYFQIFIARSQEKPGAYWYMLPKTSQAKRVIWQGRGKDGVKFLDHIPAPLIKKINNSEMYVETWNGSVLHILGSDNYDNYVGSNPLGVVFSEYSICDPTAWDYIRPILVENGGWALFCYTPRGRNHGYNLLKSAQADPKRWYVSVLTVDDTKDNDGSRIVSTEDIENERADGMSDDMVEQEFYCSFDAAQPGAYFAKEMKKARAEHRITSIPIEKYISTFTFWDLGISDDMSIWLMQPVGKELRMIACYSNSGYGMDHYVDWLLKFADKHSIRWGRHFGPHDLAVRELISGVSRIDAAKKVGISFDMVERVTHKQDSIDSLRALFPRIWFDKQRCDGANIEGIQYGHGIGALESYHRDYDEKKKVMKSHPTHDWSSNLSDAAQQMGLIWDDGLIQKKQSGITHNQSRPAPSSGGWMGS